MRARDYIPAAIDGLKSARVQVSDLLIPTLRLGVTGLSRAGKTVFITSLVRNLTEGGRLPFFEPMASGRFIRSYLEPQPDDTIPRFDYEAHIEALSAKPPRWPESTRRISQLRLTIEYRPANALAAAFGPAKLHLDIVDYPGEWLVDLTLLDQSFDQWAMEALNIAGEPHRALAAAPFQEFLAASGSWPTSAEHVAIEGARLYRDYMSAARRAERLSVLTPGRFVMPGDLEGSPLLTFFPLPAGEGVASGELQALLRRRFESYKTNVVRPFFETHFARLDRQIVLVDALGAIDQGPSAVADLERALTAIMRAFRPGGNTWLAWLLGRRIDRIVFAATKADHVYQSAHDRLEAILRVLTARATARSEGAGAEIRTVALAALRATREAEARGEGGRLPCLVGVPLPGEVLDGRTFDGTAEAAIFPGDLPADPSEVLTATGTDRACNAARFVRFRPRRLERDAAGPIAAPHVRLDRAIDHLLSDRLA